MIIYISIFPCVCLSDVWFQVSRSESLKNNKLVNDRNHDTTMRSRLKFLFLSFYYEVLVLDRLGKSLLYVYGLNYIYIYMCIYDFEYMYMMKNA